MKTVFDKLQVARLQLDTSIELMFRGGDIVSVHTLASASIVVLADLLEAKGKESWTKKIIETYPGQEKDRMRVFTEARNFFKHADRDADKVLEFDESSNDETIIIATLEYGSFQTLTGKKHSNTTQMSVFQLWYFAKKPDLLLGLPDDRAGNIIRASRELFPDLQKFPRFRQLALGAEVLKQKQAKGF